MHKLISKHLTGTTYRRNSFVNISKTYVNSEMNSKQNKHVSKYKKVITLMLEKAALLSL